jgi:hypothetical protein
VLYIPAEVLDHSYRHSLSKLPVGAKTDNKCFLTQNSLADNPHLECVTELCGDGLTALTQEDT